jgi:hypothetical protein
MSTAARISAAGEEQELSTILNRFSPEQAVPCIQEDWPAAYAAPDLPSRRRCTSQRFNLAQNYRSDLGFEPETIHVSACEERGTKATAHVVLTGGTATKAFCCKDEIVLSRDDNGCMSCYRPTLDKARKR